MEATDEPTLTLEIPTSGSWSTTYYNLDVTCHFSEGEDATGHMNFQLRLPAPDFTVSAPGAYVLGDPTGYTVEITPGETMADITLNSWTFTFSGPGSSSYRLENQSSSSFQNQVTIPAENIKKNGYAEVRVTLQYSGYRSETKYLDFKIRIRVKANR